MTAEEWKKVDKSLKFVMSRGTTLKIDGYKVHLFLTQKSQFQNAIAFYVNDEFRGKWLMEDCEERRRFCCCKKRSIITELVARKLSRNLKTSLVTMSIFHTGQTLRK